MLTRMAQFEKVSYQQFEHDCINNGITSDADIKKAYDNIKLPVRATAGSAGYDFYSPFDINVGSSTTIPTGIRCAMEQGWMLALYPRSGIGFKYAIRLANTVGIIDSDYYNSNNEGHIMVKMVNPYMRNCTIHEGDRFCQGVFTPYGITYTDEADGVRNGGFGSTNE